MHVTCALIIISVSVDLTVVGKESHFDQELKKGSFEVLEMTDLFGGDTFISQNYTF